ncbi:MAG: chemotaxis protein CheW [Rhodospirillaceae bacterium]
MADFVAALWSEFACKTQEQLDAVESVLVAAEAGKPVCAERVALLLRAFHSVRDLAGAMDLRGMESIARSAEDLLILARQGAAAFDPGLATARLPAPLSVLLPALESLRRGLRMAVTERRDLAAPEAVLLDLEHARERLTGSGAVTPSGAGAVCDDPEMLAYFVELLQAALPVFNGIVTADFANPQLRLKSLDAIELIEQAAGTMNFLALVEHMRALRAIVEATGERMLYPDARKDVLRLLGLIGEVLNEIKRSGDGPVLAENVAPHSALRRIIGRTFEDELRETYCNAVQALALFGRKFGSVVQPVDSDEILADEIAGMARLLYSFTLFLNWPLAGGVLLLIEDIFSRAASRGIFLGAETVTLTGDALTAVFGSVIDADCPSERWSDITPEAMGEFTRKFRKSLIETLNPTRVSLAPIKVGWRFLATLEIKPALLEMLSPDNVCAIMDMVQVGYVHLYEVLANPEKSPDMTRAFLAWTQSQVKQITNRSVFIDGETWFEFLIASAESPAAVIARVAEIDPAGSFIHIKPCLPRPAPARPEPAPAPARPEPATARPEPALDTSSGSRVSSEAIDTFLDQIGEMVSLNGALGLVMQDSMIAGGMRSLRSGLLRLAVEGGRPEAEALVGVVDLLQNYIDKMRQIEGNLTASLKHLQAGVLELRVVPIDAVFARFPRLVRELAAHRGKQIRLEVDGGSVRIDKSMVEPLADAIMHMLHNAIGHGIEEPEHRRLAEKPVVATITLNAARNGNRVMIEVRDDGVGLDIETVRRIAVERGLVGAAAAAQLASREVCHFIFQPGFSVAAAVTESSERGIGMDAVWSNVSRLGGSIDVDSEAGKGTCFTLSLPLTAAIQSALIIEADGNMMAIPERFLAETCHVIATDVQTIRGQGAILLRDQFLPVFPLTRLLGHALAEPVPARFPVVVIESGHRRLGLIVDRLYQRQDLYVKDIHPQLTTIPGVGGASTLGDGRVILILDGDDLFRLAEASVRIDVDGVRLR